MKNIVFEYDKKYQFEKRKAEAENMLSKHPDKIPVIIQKNDKSQLVLPENFKTKFLISPEQTVSAFMFELRKRLTLTPEQALFLSVNNLIPPFTSTMGDVYQKHKDEDGFLKMIFCEENTFGYH